ncbi:MAG: hypothetical protein AAFQ80_09180 [Cyanobacteria bacterium J06621_8]
MTESKHPWQPLGNLANPAGFIAPAIVQSNLSESDFQNLSQTANKILKNPLSVRQVSNNMP